MQSLRCCQSRGKNSYCYIRGRWGVLSCLGASFSQTRLVSHPSVSILFFPLIFYHLRVRQDADGYRDKREILQACHWRNKYTQRRYFLSRNFEINWRRRITAIFRLKMIDRKDRMCVTLFLCVLHLVCIVKSKFYIPAISWCVSGFKL